MGIPTQALFYVCLKNLCRNNKPGIAPGVIIVANEINYLDMVAFLVRMYRQAPV